MTATVAGGIKAHKTVLERYGEDFVRERNAKGGRATGRKGFAAVSREQRQAAGRKGGLARVSKGSNKLQPNTPQFVEAVEFISGDVQKIPTLRPLWNWRTQLLLFLLTLLFAYNLGSLWAEFTFK